MVKRQVLPTDSLNFKIVQSCCEHLIALCEEATKLSSEMRLPQAQLEFIPGLVVALVAEGMEVSTAVVCVFKKGHPHELQFLWTEDTMNERLARMRVALGEFQACNKDPEQFAQLIASKPSKDPWKNLQQSELEDALNTKTRRFSENSHPDSSSSHTRRSTVPSPGSAAAIRDLRNENSKLFAELQVLREVSLRPVSPRISTADAPAAEILSLRRRLQSVEKRSHADRARIEAKAAELAQKEAEIAQREVSVAKREWVRLIEEQRRPVNCVSPTPAAAKIPPPPTARSETAAPQTARQPRRWR